MPYGGDPANDPRDEFRLIVGDTNPLNPIFSDSEIDYYITKYGDVEQGALSGLYALKAVSAHCVTESVGSTDRKSVV